MIVVLGAAFISIDWLGMRLDCVLTLEGREGSYETPRCCEDQCEKSCHKVRMKGSSDAMVPGVVNDLERSTGCPKRVNCAEHRLFSVELEETA